VTTLYDLIFVHVEGAIQTVQHTRHEDINRIILK